MASNFLAFKKKSDLSYISVSKAFLPSNNNPLGTLPSEHIPFNYTTLSFSSLSVLNIFIILDMDFTLFLIFSLSIILY